MEFSYFCLIFFSSFVLHKRIFCILHKFFMEYGDLTFLNPPLQFLWLSSSGQLPNRWSSRGGEKIERSGVSSWCLPLAPEIQSSQFSDGASQGRRVEVSSINRRAA